MKKILLMLFILFSFTNIVLANESLYFTNQDVNTSIKIAFKSLNYNMDSKTTYFDNEWVMPITFLDNLHTEALLMKVAIKNAELTPSTSIKDKILCEHILQLTQELVLARVKARILSYSLAKLPAQYPNDGFTNKILEDTANDIARIKSNLEKSLKSLCT